MSHITHPAGGAPASSQTPTLFSAQRVRIQHIARAKAEGIPLTMLTAYDALTAPILGLRAWICCSSVIRSAT